ncbi:Hemerythrin [Mycobacteroides abscessus]|nr:Hemerythrin [Mycobacteroides abscessus]
MSEPSGTEQSFNEANIAEFRANGGKVGGQFEGFPLMLLTSVGAKSGAERVNPLAYFDIDGKAYIVAPRRADRRTPPGSQICAPTRMSKWRSAPIPKRVPSPWNFPAPSVIACSTS